MSLPAADDFSRYQIIIDKRPFGDEPAEVVDPSPIQISDEQSFAKNLRLTMLFEGPGGDLRAGFIDSVLKKNYILKPGQSENGLELVEADLEAAEATLRKGREVALFKMKEDTSTPAPKKKPAPRVSSYAARRQALLKKIEDRKKAEKPKPPQLTGVELRKHLEDVQMDAIRTGKPPLPMPLTPEMDDQLVSEGVLEP